MSQPKSRAMGFRIVLYCATIAFILGVAQIQRLMSGNLFEPLVSSLSSLQQRQFDALLNMNSLVTTLCTGLLGALGFLLVNGGKVQRWSAAMWLALASAGCAVLSLLFGYVAYLALIDMLRQEMFNLDLPAILWVRQAQFYAFLLAVVLFGDFAFQTLHAEEEHESNPTVAGD